MRRSIGVSNVIIQSLLASSLRPTSDQAAFEATSIDAATANTVCLGDIVIRGMQDGTRTATVRG